MLKNFQRLGIFEWTILIVAIFFMSVVWPMRAINIEHVSGCDTEKYTISGPSNAKSFVVQDFSPMYEQVKSIKVYVANDKENTDSLLGAFRLYDYTGKCLVDTTFDLGNYEFPGFIEIPLSIELTPGVLYRYIILGMDNDLFLSYVGDEVKTPENGALSYKEVPATGMTLATQFIYERPMGLKRIIASDCLIAIVAIIMFCVTLFLRQKLGNQKWFLAEKILKFLFYLFIVGGIIFAGYQILIKGAFENDLLNKIVLFLSVLIWGILLGVAIKCCPSSTEKINDKEMDISDRMISILRGLIWAAAIIFCCLNTNSMTDYEKGLHLRCLLTTIGLLLVSYSKKKEIINIPNLIWTIVAFIYGKYYVAQNSAHIEHITTAIRSSFVIWAIGLVVINLIYCSSKGRWKKIKEISFSFLGLWILFWGGCIVFSNGKKWPLLFLIVFLIVSYKYFLLDNKMEVLADIKFGIILAFIGGTIFCLYRRPYQYYMLTRYGGLFYTSTSTAVYLLLSVCASITGTIGLKQNQNIKKNLIYFVLTGTSMAYIGFTASRTGVLAAMAVFIFAFLLPTGEKFSIWIKKSIYYASILFVSIFIMFIATFGITRMIPAMVGNPLYYYFEKENAFIDKTTGLKGDNTIHRYVTFQLALEKLFGRLFYIEEDDREVSYTFGPQIASTDISDGLKGFELETYSNGRIEIFLYYIKNLNLTGHENMSVTDDFGNEIMHAHNSYLQVAYDFGIITGIVFLILCLTMFIRGIIYALNKQKGINRYLPLFLVVAFGIASFVEWVFHPCLPMGFIIIMIQLPLLEKVGKK